MKRILSAALALIMVIGTLTAGMVFPASADIVGGTPLEGNYLQALKDAFDQDYATPEEKLNDPNMQEMVRDKSGRYILYCNRFTGEVAYKDAVTGKVLTTNPVDLSNINMPGMDYTKENPRTHLLSQLIISFVDNTGLPRLFYSYNEAAYRNQIAVNRMSNGFRVEYTMGRLNTTYLLPGVVLKSDYLMYVQQVLDDLVESVEIEFGSDSKAYADALEASNQIKSWYVEYNYEDDLYAEANQDKYPVYGPETPLVMLDDSITDTEKVYLESLIKTYCPDINQDVLDAMHAETGYVQVNNETPVFRAAIEYTLDENGLTVSLPATSIRFDESKYTLQYVQMLPFFGAGNLNNKDGYLFYPDGSGALIKFGDFYSTTTKTEVSLSSTIYGEDYAYYDIDTDAKHAETVRMPVFGVVDVKNSVSRGFLGIMEEGDALADIEAKFGAGDYNYGGISARFYPRPSDKYNLSEAISVAENEEMTIVSEKKYTGFYRIRYVMLYDDADLVALAAKNLSGHAADYIGMAEAYRDYLVENKFIEKMTAEEVREGNLPLYIETFGSIETTKKFLSIPFEVQEALTSFKDIETMYNKLKDEQITNVNFKLTGFANGGMSDPLYPNKLKWMRSVGGKAGFRELLTFARDENIGIYPDFDFTYITRSGSNGVNLRKHVARAVDDRYCSKQVYDSVYQEYWSQFTLCVSPNSVLKFVDKFVPKYQKYDPIGISVSTLASDLNSNFDTDNTYNRADAQKLIAEALATVNNSFGSVMSDGGNIYSVQFLDHILNVPIDSSRNAKESVTVPFLGMVLHGYVNYAGSAINEAGDSRYQLLKSIENGALLYYILCYQNTNLLKDDMLLSEYYSVRFDIWFDTVVEHYKTLNGAIGDLQQYLIVDHGFLIGERIPSETESAFANEDAFKAVLAHLNTQVVSGVEAIRYERRVMQMVQNFVLSGVTDKDALAAKLSDALVVASIGDTEKAIIDQVLATDPAAFENLNNREVKVFIETDALTASIEEVCGFQLTEDMTKMLAAFIRENSCATAEEADEVVDALVGFVLKTETTDSFATAGSSYKKTVYTTISDMLVYVTYSNGTQDVTFVLNYNDFDVMIRLPGVNNDQPFKVEANNFSRLNGVTIAD